MSAAFQDYHGPSCPLYPNNRDSRALTSSECICGDYAPSAPVIPAPDNKSLDLEAIVGAFKAIINESESPTLRLCKLDASCDQILFRLRAQGASEQAKAKQNFICEGCEREVVTPVYCVACEAKNSAEWDADAVPSPPAGPALTPKEASPDFAALYHDLIYQVQMKYPGESRHESAKRIIIQSQNGYQSTQAGQAAQPGKDGTK